MCFSQIFCPRLQLKKNQLKKHYQLSGSKNQRTHNNTEKISSAFTDYELSFDESENVFNVLTKKYCSKKQLKPF